MEKRTVVVRKITDAGLQLIKTFERFSPKPYLCQAGYWTIGFGHVIRPGEEFKEIDEATGLALLSKDVLASELAVCRLVSVPLSDNQYDALVSFVFNIGSGAFQRSSLRMKVNREEHAEASQEFLRWVYAGGKPSKGLLRRRRMEATIYSTGDYDVISTW